ncbi:MAG: ATP-binding protein [Armatimonadota bacterium]|nr:ATP-binding protein [Armatimonadota bacterium]
MCDIIASFRSIDEPEPTLLVVGDLDFTAVCAFKESATSLLEKHQSIVVDLSRAPFVDSSGVRTLVEIYHQAVDMGKHLQLRGINSSTQKSLQISGFAGLFGMDSLRLEAADSRICAKHELKQADWRISESVVVGRPVLVASLREYAAEAAREAGLSEPIISDVKLAVGEALANALKHAVQPGRDKIRLRLMSCHSALVVEVTDQGPGFDPDADRAPAPEALQSGGLGIHLMRSVMDEVDFFFDEQGSKVRMLKWV